MVAVLCPNCGTENPEGQTMCCDCGRALPVTTVTPQPVSSVHGCTCDGCGICTRCVIAEYEGELH